MLPDRVSNPGPLTYESGALPIALRGPAREMEGSQLCPVPETVAFYDNDAISKNCHVNMLI